MQGQSFARERWTLPILNLSPICRPARLGRILDCAEYSRGCGFSCLERARLIDFDGGMCQD
jgi:hypothetical protein